MDPKAYRDMYSAFTGHILRPAKPIPGQDDTGASFIPRLWVSSQHKRIKSICNCAFPNVDICADESMREHRRVALVTLVLVDRKRTVRAIVSEPPLFRKVVSHTQNQILYSTTEPSLLRKVVSHTHSKTCIRRRWPYHTPQTKGRGCEAWRR